MVILILFGFVTKKGNVKLPKTNKRDERQKDEDGGVGETDLLFNYEMFKVGTLETKISKSSNTQKKAWK
jgi:hypothetical protein